MLEGGARMRRFLSMMCVGRVTGDPVSVLWHYVAGRMVDWVNGKDGPVCWKAGSHRGVQWLDKVEFPRKQRRYIFSPLFEIRYDTAFEEVIRGCADLAREGKTWISEEYIRAMVALNRMGFAHSYEAWNEGKLVGGGFGLQLGSMLTCDSMFHRMSNASKAAYGQMLVRARERGFKIVDTNGVATHQVNYGEEWVPQWMFEQIMYKCLGATPAPMLVDGRAYPRLPWPIRTMLPLMRIGRKMGRKIRWKKKASGVVESSVDKNAPGGDHRAAEERAAPPPPTMSGA
jgi:leucyl/phenylalanyl-tRNA--protein transferase